MKVGNNFIKNFKFHRRKLFLKLIFPFLIFIHSFDSYMSTITLKKKDVKTEKGNTIFHYTFSSSG